MQHTPVVQLPRQKRHNDLVPLLVALAIIAIVVLAVQALPPPATVTTTPAVSLYANPEVAQAERYLAWRAAAARAYANPEAARAERYLAWRAASVDAYVNPEVAQAERFLARRIAAEAVAGPVNPELSSANYYGELIAQDRFLRQNPEIRRYWQSQAER